MDGKNDITALLEKPNYASIDHFAPAADRKWCARPSMWSAISDIVSAKPLTVPLFINSATLSHRSMDATKRLPRCKSYEKRHLQ
jgi:hypothetical protein